MDKAAVMLFWFIFSAAVLAGLAWFFGWTWKAPRRTNATDYRSDSSARVAAGSMQIPAAIGFGLGWTGGKARGREEQQMRAIYETCGGDAARDEIIARRRSSTDRTLHSDASESLA